MVAKIFFVILVTYIFPNYLMAQIADTIIIGSSVQVNPNGTVPVSINCPTGYKVISGAWQSDEGELFVPRSYPANTSLDQWLFQFRNNGSSAITVNPFIVCRKGGLDTLIEGPSVSVNQDKTVPVSANCPTGYNVVSGGWEASGGNQLFVPRSYPANTSLDQWLFQFRNNDSSTSNVNTFIICSRSGLDTLIEGESNDVNSNITVGLSVYSPTQYKIVSVGWEASGGNQILLPSSYPANNLFNQWVFHFKNNGGTTSTISTFAICNRNITTDVNVSEYMQPRLFRLGQNFPNPFNPSTVIEYDLPKDIEVKIVLYDILGRQVKTLIDDVKFAGSYKIELNAEDLSSGVYFYQLQTSEFTKTKKLLLMK